MDQMNKIISLAIGLIVVVISFAALTGRVDLSKNFPQFAAKNTITPTPALQVDSQPIVQVASESNMESSAPTSQYSSSSNSQGATQIPETGNPVATLALAMSAMALGQYLKRIK